MKKIKITQIDLTIQKLAKDWRINAEFLYFKGIQIRSFRFKSLSLRHKKRKVVHLPFFVLPLTIHIPCVIIVSKG